jgi:O-antigen/teichoic acid export membrane protein
MRFSRLLSSTVGAQIYSSALLLLVGVITAKYLGPHDRGIYSLIFSTAGITGIVLGMGMYQANVYFQNKHQINPLVLTGNSLAFYILQAALLLSILYLFKDFIAIYFESQNPTDIILLLWGVTLTLVLPELLGGIVMGQHKYQYYLLYIALSATAVFISTLPLFMINLESYTAALYRMLALFPVIALLLTITLKEQNFQKLQFDSSVLVQQLRFGCKNVLQNCVGVLNYRAYPFFLIFFIDATAVGIFSVAVLFAEIIRFLPNAFGIAIFPIITGKTDHKDAGQLIAQMCRLSFILTIIITSIASFSIFYIVDIIFGQAYKDVAMPGIIMMAGSTIAIFYQLLTRYFTGINKQKYSIYCALIALSLTLGLSYSLVPLWGVVGAAWAFFASNCAQGLLMIFVASRTSEIPLFDFIVIKKSDLLQIRNTIFRY